MKFGGLTALAGVADVKPHTVMRWRMPKERGGTGGIIPHWHMTTILEEAKARRIKLDAVDFLPAKEQVRA